VREDLDIRALEKTGLPKLVGALEAYPYLPYTGYREVDRAASARRVGADLSALLDGGGFCFSAQARGRSVGVVAGQALPWDSGQLGVPAGRLAHLLVWDPGAAREGLVAAAVSECRTRGLRHVSVRIPSDDVPAIHACEEHGFRMMEALLTFSFRMDRDRPLARARGFRVAPCDGSEAEIAWVRDVAGRVFQQDRFHSDPHIPRERADELHRAWMENSCRGFADVVLIAKDPETGERLGFFTGKVHHLPELPLRFGNLVLGAVAPEGRGRGAFTDLTLGGLEWARPRVDVLEIGTQFMNVNASRVYLGAGFRYVRSDVSLRLWLGD
jgi:hypothetical protein